MSDHPITRDEAIALAARLAVLGREVGEAFAVAALALADGVITEAERAELGRELVDVVQAAQQALGALGVAHGPAIVKGGRLG